jgi:hypothetical protein
MMARLKLALPGINYGSDDQIEFPALSNSLTLLPDKFYRWGSQQDKPFHCFVDDWRLEAIWRDQYKMLDRVCLAGFAIAPDYTVDKNHPLPFAFYQVWRSRVVARWWQDHGVYVVPVLQWSRPAINHFLFAGLHNCEVVAVRSPTRGTQDQWLECVGQYLEFNQPKLVLHFGTKSCFNVWPNALNLKLNPSKKHKP